MMQSVKSVYDNGKIQLLEEPGDTTEAQVIVTEAGAAGEL